MSGASGCKEVAIIDKELCKQYMCTGPVIRAAGVPYDIRKVYPYLGYENYQFDIPTASRRGFLCPLSGPHGRDEAERFA